MMVHACDPSYSGQRSGGWRLKVSPSTKLESISTNKLSMVVCSYNPISARAIGAKISVQASPGKNLTLSEK
jgi:hypothetical protein